MSEPASPEEHATQPGMGSIQDAPETVRRIQRWVMRGLPRLRQTRLALRDAARRLRGAPLEIEFFHQVDDPYSDLAIQAIPALLERYDVVFRFHLVGPAERLYVPEPERLAAYARGDCARIAPYYGLTFPAAPSATPSVTEAPPAPTPERVARVQALLAPRLEAPDFAALAVEAGRALWTGDETALSALERRSNPGTPDEVESAIAGGERLRRKAGHYSGGMFRETGEWYWGVDRLHHLERRLIRQGLRRPGAPDGLRFDRPPIDAGPVPNGGRLRLEIYPSLRSPYTAFIFDRSLALAESVDVPVELRPVMPMVMRGVPAPAAKAIYIFLDALREARHLGAPFGDMHDPIGRAVLRGFSLWPFAHEAGRGAEYLSSFLRAAFAEGRPTGSDAGLRFVVERAGLDWEAARERVDGDEAVGELERNRQALYEDLGLWGVPSYRLLDADGSTLLSVWGQDRLWLVAATIRERLSRPAETEG
jgi:2-hydroxychromene-2-carboxylate isomerase